MSKKLLIILILCSLTGFAQTIRQDQVRYLPESLDSLRTGKISIGDSTVFATKYRVDTLQQDVAANADTINIHRDVIDSLVNENYQYVMVHQQSYLPWSDAMGWGPAAGGDSTMENLRLAFSRDGRRDWVDIGVVFDPVWNLRDPSMIQVGDTFFVACTRNAFAGTGYGYFTIIKSGDLFNWTEVANISCAWISEDGVNGVNAVWAPKWFYDEIKDSTYLIVSIAHDGQPFQMYAMRALNNNMNSFANGQQLVITGKPSAIDGNVIIKDNQYYFFYKNEGCAGNKCYEMAVGDDFYGPYTVYHEGNWMPSWGYDIESFEIRKFGSVYRLYMDKYYNRDPFKDNGNVGRGYAESYDLINWSPLYDLNIHTGASSVLKVDNLNLYNIRSKRGNPYFLEVGGDPYNYALKMEGIREALRDLDSGVVYVNYPGVNDTTGLGAIPAKKYIRGWIAGKYTNGNALTSFGGDVYLPNGILRQKLDTLTTILAPQWSGTSTGLNASTARTSLSLNNLTNKAQVELEDSTGGAPGNYITWKRLNDWIGSTAITTLGTIAGGFTATRSVGAITANTSNIAGTLTYTPTANEGTYTAQGATITAQKAGAFNLTSAGGLVGVLSTAENTGSGNVSYMRGNSAVVRNNGVGTVSSGYAFYAFAPTANSSNPITNAYGMYIEAQAKTGVTNAYGIYSAGTEDNNYFNGMVTARRYRLIAGSGADLGYPHIRQSGADANGRIMINSYGTGDISINVDPGSGTSGFRVYSGGASPTEVFAVSSAGAVTSSGNIVGGGTLDVRGGNVVSLTLGSDVGAGNTRTNATNKAARIAIPHYLTAEEPVGLITGSSFSSGNEVNIGGGSALLNTSTSIRFFTAANTTTITGTEVGRFDINGFTSFGNILFTSGANNVLLKSTAVGQLSLRNASDTQGGQLVLATLFTSDNIYLGGSTARNIGSGYNVTNKDVSLVGGFSGSTPSGATITAYGSTHATNANQIVLTASGNIVLTDVPVYADNAAATSGGLTAGMVYRTSTGQLMIVY
jgi:hypothetical protein